MKLISCSECYEVKKPKETTIIDGKRVCHTCKSKKSRAIARGEYTIRWEDNENERRR